MANVKSDFTGSFQECVDYIASLFEMPAETVAKTALSGFGRSRKGTPTITDNEKFAVTKDSDGNGVKVKMVGKTNEVKTHLVRQPMKSRDPETSLMRDAYFLKVATITVRRRLTAGYMDGNNATGGYVPPSRGSRMRS